MGNGAGGKTSVRSGETPMNVWRYEIGAEAMLGLVERTLPGRFDSTSDRDFR